VDSVLDISSSADYQHKGVSIGKENMAIFVSAILFVFLMGAVTLFGYGAT